MKQLHFIPPRGQSGFVSGSIRSRQKLTLIGVITFSSRAAGWRDWRWTTGGRAGGRRQEHPPREHPGSGAAEPLRGVAGRTEGDAGECHGGNFTRLMVHHTGYRSTARCWEERDHPGTLVDVPHTERGISQTGTSYFVLLRVYFARKLPFLVKLIGRGVNTADNAGR